MSEVTEETAVAQDLEVSASLIRKMNLADYQNAVPALQELEIRNNSNQRRDHLIVSVSSAPSFFKQKQWHLEAIAPGQTYSIKDLDLQLDGPLLGRLSESEFSRVRFDVRQAESSHLELAVCERDVELLPRNHWGGLAHLPEMIAAFVQPNDASIDRLLKKAAQSLRENGKNSALNGYGAGPKHAWEILAAIWAAVAAEELDYVLPAASFEITGQKVRSPTQILDAGLGTCLDLALLFAATAEQAGLNPLVVFTKGHAFSGCWLRPEEFATTGIDDPAALRKRLRLQELILFETTVVTQVLAPPFSRAVELGTQQLAEDALAPYEFSVDIRRARMHKIRPLAAGEATAIEPHDGTDTARIIIEEAPDFPDVGLERDADPPTLTATDRVARWQRKLLDLSLRNSLLNFRKGKRAVLLEAPDPGKLEDTLAEGQVVRLLPHPLLMEGSDPRSKIVHEGRVHEDLRKQHALEALTKRDVFVAAEADELECTLVELYRAARTSLEEGGANTLFLALGFLIWTQEGKAQKYKAPLILIPVTLTRRSVRSGFTMSLHEDEPQFNPTLVQMLNQDFRLHLGIVEGELPKDESGLDVTGIWRSVSEAVKDFKGWEVISDVVLSTFSFAKHLMWKDLVQRTDQLRQNPVVRHLIDTPRDSYLSDVPFSSPKSLDKDYDPSETFCPLPADSSQLAAVMSAARGKDFVLIGPPGTGKSQTIANLIAHCIASGKRVLLVAEKIAALEVVYRRLRSVGLDQFCLEIHSSKAKKTSVLSALGAAWDARREVDAQGWSEEACRVKTLRDHLNIYVERLHRQHPNGLTVHRALGTVVTNSAVPYVALSWPDLSLHHSARLQELMRTAGTLDVHLSAFGVDQLRHTPLLPVQQSQWTPIWQNQFLQTVRLAQSAANQAEVAYKKIAQVMGLPESSLTAPARHALAELAVRLPGSVGRNWCFATKPEAQHTTVALGAAASILRAHRIVSAEILDPWPEHVIAACRSGLKLLQEWETLRAEMPAPWPRSVVEQLARGAEVLQEILQFERLLSVRYIPAVANLDTAALERDWHEAEQSAWPMSWMVKRRIKSALVSVVTGGGEPDIENDLSVLTRLAKLRAEAAAIELSMLPVEVWSGLGTNVESARAAVRLQAGLASVRDGEPWIPDGLEVISSGLCGPGLKQTLNALEKLTGISEELRPAQWLSVATDNLWTGIQTNSRNLAAAVTFCEQWKAKALQNPHDSVERGSCGPRLQAQYRLLRECTRMEAKLTAFAYLNDDTGGLWHGIDTDLADVESAIQFATALGKCIPAIANGADEVSRLRNAIEVLFTSNSTSGAQIRDDATAFIEAVATAENAVDQMAQAGCFDVAAIEEFRTLGMRNVEQRCESFCGAAPRLQRWCSWRQIRVEALACGLGPLVLAIEEGRIEPGGAINAFEANYCRWWIDQVVSADEVLRQFVSAEHELRIADFRSVDDRYTTLTRAWIQARVCAAFPYSASMNASSEWGILRRELSKKKRHLPLRELMERIPSVVNALTPCLLMSPLSIAQYLAASDAAFDIVVFDEASQIAVWDAIGAIARARQVVMVGDPKQLPPTNFFNKADAEEDADDTPDDLESILDECLGANLPAIQLSWHYRSRHESLIAFSNRRYYGGELVTFPSPVTDDHAVSFHYVPGVYERGGARVNQAEAKAVVADVVVKLESPAFLQSGHSIGVVTFNAEQQKLIEDLLDAERRKNPSLEVYFSDARMEPVFVKNLESVQGDERDLMYFSITYGPDKTGRPSMNFGPMNRDGGERRLNVAITRARRELKVFSSLRSDQIEVSRTRSVGVGELKRFLKYAERGLNAFADSTPSGISTFESPFEEFVATALQSRGWTIHTQVGASTFRVDLGVIHPDAPGDYLAGIECDGASYHRSATARDRDKLRYQVLCGLGWKILRVWSTDWWIDKETTLCKLDADLHLLLEESRRKRAEVAESDAEELPFRVSTAPAPSPGEYRNYLGETLPTEATRPETSLDGMHPDPARFFDRSYDAVLGSLVARIVEKEGPVSDEVLARRVARTHGWQRTGARINERVTRIASRAFRKTKEDVGTFFWPVSLEVGQPVRFRPGISRSVDEICLEELVSLASEIVASGREGEDARVSLARELGLRRPSTSNSKRLNKALTRARELL